MLPGFQVKHPSNLSVKLSSDLISKFEDHIKQYKYDHDISSYEYQVRLSVFAQRDAEIKQIGNANFQHDRYSAWTEEEFRSLKRRKLEPKPFLHGQTANQSKLFGSSRMINLPPPPDLTKSAFCRPVWP